MSLFELFLIAVGLSMDAFAVSVCKGLATGRMRKLDAVRIGAWFGGFQALMPLLGWLLGRQFESYITSIDHWIAFILLGFIGGKMIWEAVRGGEEETGGGLGARELFVLAVATSIDALAVGVSFAFLNVNIWSSVAFIGVTTFVLSVFGALVGGRLGEKFKDRAEIAGGAILVLMGLKILLQHLGVINF